MRYCGRLAGVALFAAMLAACSDAHSIAFYPHEKPSAEQMRGALTTLLASRPELSMPEFELSLKDSPAVNTQGIVRIGSFDCDPESLLFDATFSGPNLTLRELEGRFELDSRHKWRAIVVRSEQTLARDPNRRVDWYPSNAFSWSKGDRP